MSTKRFKPEQIVNLLRQIEVAIANGKTTPQACRDAAITVQTYYRWRKEFGGLKLDQAKRLKELEKENPLSQFRDFPGKHQEDEILAS
jgi:putative transposase